MEYKVRSDAHRIDGKIPVRCLVSCAVLGIVCHGTRGCLGRDRVWNRYGDHSSKKVSKILPRCTQFRRKFNIISTVACYLIRILYSIGSTQYLEEEGEENFMIVDCWLCVKNRQRYTGWVKKRGMFPNIRWCSLVWKFISLKYRA